MPIAKYASFVGFGKETTRGTAVAPTLFTPATDFKPEDVRNYVSDTGIRGSYVESYNEIPTQGWATYEFSGPVYVDTIGAILKGLLGDETVSGTAPYTHVFSVLNSGQPPSFTVTDYNGFNARQFPGAQFSSLEMKFDASGLLECTAKATAMPSTTTTKPAQTFSAVAAKPGYTGVVTIAGTQTGLVESGTLTIARKVDPILAVNGTQSPKQIWGEAVSFSGSLTIIYEDDTFLTPMLSGTQQTLDVVFGSTPASLQVHGSQALFTKATVERSKDWVELAVDFTGVANTTDAGASGGYSPVKATLINAVTAVY